MMRNEEAIAEVLRLQGIERDYQALVAALKVAAPHVCSLTCPSIKKTGFEWSHSADCQAVQAALTRSKEPR